MEQQGVRYTARMVATSLSPDDIVGPGNMRLFVEFLNVARSASNGGEFPRKRLVREIGDENLKRISVVLEELRINGYFPGYVDDKGKVRWKVVVKSKAQELFEKGLSDLRGRRISELQDMARSGYLKLFDDVQSERER